MMKWMAYVHGVCVIPGSSCGAPGHFRVCYANLPAETFATAVERLQAAVEEICDEAFDVATLSEV